MKQYNIKKITIRFISGEEECATLLQLRRSFNPKDVLVSFSQMHKWLSQVKNDEARDISSCLTESKDKILEDSPESLFLLYQIFFKQYVEANHITDILCLFVSWENKREYKVDYNFLYEEIKKRKWGEPFLYSAVEDIIGSETKEQSCLYTAETLFHKYKSLLSDYFENDQVSSLSDLFIHLATLSKYQTHFFFLNRIIREYEWSTEFFLKLMPSLFRFDIDEEKYNILQMDNIYFPLESEKGVFSFYYVFLEKLFKEKKNKNLVDVFFTFLNGRLYEKVFDILHHLILYSQWNLGFTYKVIPKLSESIRGGDNTKESFGTIYSFNKDSSNDLYLMYDFFLNRYFKSNHISDLRQLYLFWDANNELEPYYLQLHREIESTAWGYGFINDNLDYIIKNFRHVDFSTDEAYYVMDESECFGFFNKYFCGYLKDKKIKDLPGLYISWSGDSDYNSKSCFDYLSKIMKKNVWGVRRMLEIYKKHNSIHDRDGWHSILQDIKLNFKNNAAILFEVGKLIVEDFCLYSEGIQLLRDANSLGSRESVDYINHHFEIENKISNNFKRYYTADDIEEWRAKPNGDQNYETNENLQLLARTTREKSILIVQNLIHRIIDNSDLMKVDNFVLYMRNYTNPDVLYSYEFEPIDSLIHAFSRTDWSRASGKRVDELMQYKGSSFLEIRFVFALVCWKYENMSKHGEALLKLLSSKYPPAKYVLDNSVKNEVLDQYAFRDMLNRNFSDALKVYCTKVVSLVNE